MELSNFNLGESLPPEVRLDVYDKAKKFIRKEIAGNNNPFATHLCLLLPKILFNFPSVKYMQPNGKIWNYRNTPKTFVELKESDILSITESSRSLRNSIRSDVLDKIIEEVKSQLKQPKNMKYTIKDLAEGKCILHNDGSLVQLKKVLKKAFPTAKIPEDVAIFYFAGNDGNWRAHNLLTSALPVQSVKEFDLDGFPKIMMVSDSPITEQNTGHKRVVFMKKCGKFIAWGDASTTFEEAENTVKTVAWNYAKDIEEGDKIVELTFKDISEGKGVGVDPALIRIKE